MKYLYDPFDYQLKSMIINILNLFYCQWTIFIHKNFFNKYKNLRSIVTPTTGDIHLDKIFN